MAISEKFKEQLKHFIIINDHSGTPRTLLAKEMNVDYRSFSNAINYGIIPKPISIVRIADFFNIPVKCLLGESDDEYFVKSKNPTNFLSRLDELRGATSYYQIAKDCNFDKSMCSKWKSKNHIPTLDILVILADYFDVSIDYLLGRTDDNTPYDDTELN